MANRKYTKQQIKIIRRAQSIGIRLFAGVLALGCLLGLLFFFRPDVSEKENRELTDFPQFTLSGFLDGTFFSELSLWYSDTYPLCDLLVSMDQKWKKIYGITTSTMMVGGNEQGDEIPTDDGNTESEASYKVLHISSRQSSVSDHFCKAL